MKRLPICLAVFAGVSAINIVAVDVTQGFIGQTMSKKTVLQLEPKWYPASAWSMDVRSKRDENHAVEYNMGVVYAPEHTVPGVRAYVFRDVLMDDRFANAFQQHTFGADMHLNHSDTFVSVNKYVPITHAQVHALHIYENGMSLVSTEPLAGYDVTAKHNVSVAGFASPVAMQLGYYRFANKDLPGPRGVKGAVSVKTDLGFPVESTLQIDRRFNDNQWQMSFSNRVTFGEPHKSGRQHPVMRDVDVVVGEREKYFQFVHIPKTGGTAIHLMLDPKQVKMASMVQACLQELSIQSLKH